MRAIAIVWSFGRASLNELLSMWERQTRRVPLLVWLDGAELDHATPPPGAYVHRSPMRGPADSLASMRRASIEFARTTFTMAPEDAFIILEDDDFYSSHHAARALEVLEQGAEWTGSLHIGLQHAPGRIPELVQGESGPGQHAAWAMRLRTYDAGGGYPDTRQDDVALGFAIGWKHCTPHRYLTHVRRWHGGNLCTQDYDRAAVRASATLTRTLEPHWRPELTMLEQWCAANCSALNLCSFCYGSGYVGPNICQECYGAGKTA